MRVPPAASRVRVAVAKSCGASASPKNSSSRHDATPKRNDAPKLVVPAAISRRANGSSGSKLFATSNAVDASATVRANTETQSSDRQAGTTPLVLKIPRLGFMATMLLKAAGTRPDPAVSVPSAKLTSPPATAPPEPEPPPPGVKQGANGV